MAIDGSVTLPLHTLSGAGLVSAAYYAPDLNLPGLDVSGSLQGPSPLPAFTLSATAISGASADGDAFLQSVTLEAAGHPGKAMSGSVTLPAFELAANTGTRASLTLTSVSLTATGVTGTIGRGGNKNRVGSGVLSVSSPTLSGAMKSELLLDGDCEVAAPTLQATGIAGTVGVGDSIQREVRLTATGISGTASTGDIDIPSLTLSAATADGAAATGSITLPLFSASGTMPAAPVDGTGVGVPTLALATLSGELLPGSVITASLTLREPTLEATLGNSPPMTGAISLAEFTLSAEGLGSNAAIGSVRIDPVYLSAEALAGNVGVATVEIPLMTLSASDGTLANVGTASIILPLFQIGSTALGLGGFMQNAVALASITFTGIVLNTRTKAVTNYDAIEPNSIARFNGVTLMATADGIVALTGETDQAAPIDAYFTTGKTDFGNPAMQRVLTGYVGYRAEGDMELTLIGDDHHEHIYTLSPRRVEDQQHASRVKLGRGAKAVYWQSKVANVDGCDFAIDRIELHPASTGAKV